MTLSDLEGHFAVDLEYSGKYSTHQPRYVYM